jgi:segregation and condensation protein B
MKDVDVLPELRQIVGAMLFAAKQPLAPADVVACLRAVAEDRGGAARDFAQLKEADVRATIDDLRGHFSTARLGVHIGEVAGGFRMENDAACGPWLRQYLAKGRPNRLSKPALETLAVIAYRQPCTRAEIEAVRGVAVDQIVRNLMELQLIRIVGRSELPGRPWLFGTTGKFLEYFGLKDVKELPGVEELKRMVPAKEAKPQDAQEPVYAPEEGSAEAAAAGESEGRETADGDGDAEEAVEEGTGGGHEDEGDEDEDEENEDDEDEYDDEEDDEDDEDEDDEESDR